MESPDEVGSDEINELFSLTAYLERSIANFSFTGRNVSGDVVDGFIVNRPSADTESDTG